MRYKIVMVSGDQIIIESDEVDYFDKLQRKILTHAITQIDDIIINFAYVTHILRLIE